MQRQRITLRSGQEIQVNGFIIRATGSPIGGPADSLNIYPPNMNAIPESRHDIGQSLYAGSGDAIACATSLSVGMVGNLLRAPFGSKQAKQTAAVWVHDHIGYFHPDATHPTLHKGWVEIAREALAGR